MAEPTRREFLRGILTVAAVAALPVGVLVSDLPVLWADGEHDDADALEAMGNGKPFRTADGFAGIAKAGRIHGGEFLLGRKVKLGNYNELERWRVSNAIFIASRDNDGGYAGIETYGYFSVAGCTFADIQTWQSNRDKCREHVRNNPWPRDDAEFDARIAGIEAGIPLEAK